MNQVEIALKAAGVAVPTRNERVWTLLKEEPGLDYKQVMRKLNIPAGPASSTLNALYSRSMVRMTRRALPNTTRTRATYEAVGRVFALLPSKHSVHAKQFAAAKRAAKQEAKQVVVPAPVPVPEPVVVSIPVWSAVDHVNNLTLRQAVAVYEELQGVFG